MKFAAGYQTPRNGERFSDVIADYAPDIDEVYFSWPGMASGRPDTGSGDWGAQQRLERELSALGRAGSRQPCFLTATATEKTLSARRCGPACSAFWSIWG